MYRVLSETIAELTANGEMFEITEVEVNGIKLKAWANAPGSLRDIWLSSSVYGEADYLVFEDQRITYAQAHKAVASIANWLVEQGVNQHDRVAIAMRNYPEWMLCYWAAICIGAVPVGINAWWVAEELKYGLNDCSAALLICDAERLQRFSEIRSEFEKLPVVVVRSENLPSWATPWRDVLRSSATLPDAQIAPDDDACLFYTSGTTGYPKGAQMTHRGCVNNLFSSMFAGLCIATAEAKVNSVELPDPQAEDKLQPAAIAATPLFHVTGNNGTAQAMTMVGGKLIHMYKWDVAEALRIIEDERVTGFTGVPVMGREMVSHPDFQRRDLSSLAMIGGGGSAVQPDLIAKIGETKNVSPAQGYGLTETSGMVSLSFGCYLLDKPNSAGMVIPIYDVKCIDDSGRTLAEGEIGEICLKSAQIIKGYLNRPEETAEVIVDGWLHTGDIGFVDQDGFISLVDRAKDMVIRGGENVYCSEVEVALYQFPGVAECVVFSVPDERLGEEVGAAVLPSSDVQIDEAQLREFCAEKIAAFKIPRYIWIMDKPLPRNASGKFVRNEIRNLLSISE